MGVFWRVGVCLALLIGVTATLGDGRSSRDEPGSLASNAEVALTRQFAVPVFMYHRVRVLTPKELTSPLLRDLTVSPADFEEQVAYLSSAGFTFLFASEVERAVRDGLPLPEKGVCITLDDGYLDNFDHAYPILKKYGAKATVFMTTANLQRPERLHAEHLVAMRKDAVRFGSHTVSHVDLTKAARSVLEFELVESRRVLEGVLGETIDSLAYPAGAYDDRVVLYAQKAGYRAGWKKGGGMVTPDEDMMLLPRVRVSGGHTMADFERKLVARLESIERLRGGPTLVAMR